MAKSTQVGYNSLQEKTQVCWNTAFRGRRQKSAKPGLAVESSKLRRMKHGNMDTICLGRIASHRTDVQGTDGVVHSLPKERQHTLGIFVLLGPSADEH